MSKTPKRNSLPPGFSRIKLPESPASSSQKNLTGPHRVAKDTVADVYNNIQLWNSQHLVGLELVKQIAHNRSNNIQKYNPELQELTEKLFKIVEVISKYRDAFQLYSHRMRYVIKLQPVEPLFISMTVEQMASLIDEIATAYVKEFDMKKCILENIAHENKKANWCTLVYCWVYQCNITPAVERKMEALLLETSHKKIT